MFVTYMYTTLPRAYQEIYLYKSTVKYNKALGLCAFYDQNQSVVR